MSTTHTFAEFSMHPGLIISAHGKPEDRALQSVYQLEFSAGSSDTECKWMKYVVGSSRSNLRHQFPSFPRIMTTPSRLGLIISPVTFSQAQCILA